jgi:hypothetical protein
MGGQFRASGALAGMDHASPRHEMRHRRKGFPARISNPAAHARAGNFADPFCLLGAPGAGWKSKLAHQSNYPFFTPFINRWASGHFRNNDFNERRDTQRYRRPSRNYLSSFLSGGNLEHS